MAKNPYRRWWDRATDGVTETNPLVARDRIFTAPFCPQQVVPTRMFSRDDAIWTMGSCFARGLEKILIGRGYSVSSIDYDLLEHERFLDETGRMRTGFFHRFNVPAMAQEVLRGFDEIEFDDASSLISEAEHGLYEDLNYWKCLPAADVDETVRRRRVARKLVRNLASSKLLVFTLGLTEAWFHKPSGLYANGVPGTVLGRNRDEFELRRVGFEENMAALERIYSCIEKYHETGDFGVVVTVSPVPMIATFSEEDVVVANQRSKATLRAVATEFCDRHPDKVCYFPSYEIAMYSPREFVWRSDRIHVNLDCVDHIVDNFLRFFETEKQVAVAEA